MDSGILKGAVFVSSFFIHEGAQNVRNNSREKKLSKKKEKKMSDATPPQPTASASTSVPKG